ncbi:MAG: hypothetical protein ABR905_13810 [Terracidiphilus sp.]|jgi:hypothetical protein
MADDPEFAVLKIAHVIDHDLDITQSYEVAVLDEHVYTCISLSRDAIEVGKLTGYADYEKAHIWNFVEGMRHSHMSIRKLLMGEQSASAVDALAIARLQLENLFTICFLLQSAENVRLFLKNAWKKKYVRFLLHRAEHIRLRRFDEYSNSVGAELLDKLQGASFVSDAERRTIDVQQLGYPFGPKPKLVRIEGFPTPAQVVKKINNADQKQMLARLNSEYEFLCSFAHGDGESVFLRTVADKRSPFQRLHTTSEIEKFYQEQVLEPPILYSALGSILVATEVAASFPSEVELRARLGEAWNFLTRSALSAVPPWEARARKVLGVVGG